MSDPLREISLVDQIERNLREIFDRYRELKLELDALKADRAKITGPLYKQVRATEDEFRPRIVPVEESLELARDRLEAIADRAFEIGAFGENERGQPRKRYTIDDGSKSYVQVGDVEYELCVVDYMALLENKFYRENYVVNVEITLSDAAIALVKEGKHIPGTVEYERRPVKISAKPRPEEPKAKEA